MSDSGGVVHGRVMILSVMLHRLDNLAHTIGSEIKEQGQMLNKLDEDMDDDDEDQDMKEETINGRKMTDEEKRVQPM